uniref:Uncharacterized protein n=1 Tax=Steinernema glaseri TaxID=37863 RepID=A0A1I7YGW5_9BILA
MLRRLRKWMAEKIRKVFRKEREPKFQQFPFRRLLRLASHHAAHGMQLHYNKKTIRLLQVVDSLDWSGTRGPPKRMRFVPNLPPIPE